MLIAGYTCLHYNYMTFIIVIIIISLLIAIQKTFPVHSIQCQFSSFCDCQLNISLFNLL